VNLEPIAGTQSERSVASTAPLLQLRQLSVSYFVGRLELPAVVDFDLLLRKGEAHGLVGESGCGKSTVALAIMRCLGKHGRVTSGEILFKDRDLRSLSDEELRRVRGAEIAMVTQEPTSALNPSMTIGEQLIEVPMYHERLGRRAAIERARAMLNRVQLVDDLRIMRAYPHQTSGGQQQRIVIAMALLSRPSLLLLDEPTSALDVTIEAGIVDLIAGISAEFGTTLLYISHNLGLLRATCQRITVMYAGQAVETATTPTLFGDMSHPYTQRLFAAIPRATMHKHGLPLEGIAGQAPLPQARPAGCSFGPRCDFFIKGLCDLAPVRMQGEKGVHETRCLRLGEIEKPLRVTRRQRPRAALPGVRLLEARSLTKRYGAVSANDRVTFDAREGEIVALVGESGSGKSTFARILMGLTQATSGSVVLRGLELAQLPVGRRRPETLRALQMIFQNPSDTLNPSHTVGAQIARGIRRFGVERDEGRVKARVVELLELVKLPREIAVRKPLELSGGQKQRIAIARAFAGNPSIVVADEPVSALDVSVQAAVSELLLDIQRRSATTLLFISHDLSLVRYLADRVVVMYFGQVVEQGRTEEVFAPPYHPYTEALLAAIPIADAEIVKRQVRLTGEAPSPSRPPPGCRFATRCAYRIRGTCETLEPPVREFAHGHSIACHLPAQRLANMTPIFTSRGP
jgi:peptide/nickel transport system ATP-binding protein